VGTHTILLVDDDPDTLSWLIEHIPKRLDVVLIAVTSVNEMESAISVHSFDLIVSDFRMPKRDGLEVIKVLLNERIKIPLVFYTSEPNQIRSLHGIKGDVVKKPDFDLLISTISKFL
jgi:CheY-like chemotaxis protein